MNDWNAKGEFTQYSFFVRFCPFFFLYVFVSSWKSKYFFICILNSPSPHKLDCYIFIYLFFFLILPTNNKSYKFKIEFYLFTKSFFRKLLSSMWQYSWSRYGHTKMWTKKSILSRGEEKTCENRLKRTKNGYYVNLQQNAVIVIVWVTYCNYRLVTKQRQTLTIGWSTNFSLR